MYAFGFGIHDLQESFYVGRSEFFERTVLEDDIGYLIFLTNERKRFVVDRISCLDLLGNWYLELVEENDLYLFGRVDIELLSDQIIYLELFVLRFPYDLFSDIAKLLRIHVYSCFFHVCEYLKQTRFYVDDRLYTSILSTLYERLLIRKIGSLHRVFFGIQRRLVVVLKVHERREIEIAIHGRSQVLLVTDIEEGHKNRSTVLKLQTHSTDRERFYKSVSTIPISLYGIYSERRASGRESRG